MNLRPRLLLLLLATGPAFAGPTGPAAPTALPATSPALQITVDVPASVSLLRADDLAGFLATCVQSAFRDAGYRGPLTFVAWPDTPKPSAPRLELSLIDWRMTPARFIDCTLTARFVSPTGSQDLGFASGTSFARAYGRDWFGRAEDFQAAANDAARRIYRELSARKLLPGS